MFRLCLLALAAIVFPLMPSAQGQETLQSTYLRAFLSTASENPPVCAGSARTGERTLRVSVDAALRAGIFKASGSFDPMGWSVGARRSFPRP